MNIFLLLLLAIFKEPNITTNVCDRNSIYNEEFSYGLPRVILESQFQGTAFGEEKGYSDEEINRVEQDANMIFASIMEKTPADEKTIYISAGAPGAGKTTLMEQLLAKDQSGAYTDPDAVCLKNMKTTYLQDPDYKKWRSASNAIHNCILANLVKLGKKIYFGTTASGENTHFTFKWLKEQGYRIHLIHVIAPDNVRWESIKQRDKTFVQTTEEDIRKKGTLLPQRINDTFLKYADQIDFYYRSTSSSKATRAAKWSAGKLTVKDEEVYEAMVKTHDTICKTLKNGDEFLWENSVLRNQ